MATLCADENGVAAAAGQAHARLANRACRWARADRWRGKLVDSVPWVQPSPYPAGGRAAARGNAACDVRRAGARTGLAIGAAAGGAAAGESYPRFLFRLRLGRSRSGHENGG